MDLHEAKVVEMAAQPPRVAAGPSKDVNAYLDTLAAQGLVATFDRFREL